MGQLHKKFTCNQVGELICRYITKEIERSYIQEILGIKKTRFFALVKKYKNDAESFSIEYKRKGTTRKISKEIEENIMKELQIEKRLIADPEVPNLLFYTIIKGRSGKMSEGNVERFIQQYTDKARESCPDIPLRVHPHMLRRTRATNLYQNGVELALIPRMLGHAFLDTTRVYAKPSLAMMRKVMDYVDVPQTKDEKPLWIGSEEEMAKLCGLR